VRSIHAAGICIVIRKYSLAERNVAADEFQTVTRNLNVNADNDYITIYGPLSGGDVSRDVQIEFERLGLLYLDDFYAVDLFLPPWLSIAFTFRPQ
jgi:hypothetical protein